MGSKKLKILLALALLVLHGIAYHHWKEEIKSFQTKKVDQNRTIIKEVMSKNVCQRERKREQDLKWMVLDNVGCRMGLDSVGCWMVLDGCRMMQDSVGCWMVPDGCRMMQVRAGH